MGGDVTFIFGVFDTEAYKDPVKSSEIKSKFYKNQNIDLNAHTPYCLAYKINENYIKENYDIDFLFSENYSKDSSPIYKFNDFLLEDFIFFSDNHEESILKWLYRLVSFVTSLYYKKGNKIHLVIFAHNFSGYDGFCIISSFLEFEKQNSEHVTVIIQNNKIYSLKIKTKFYSISFI